MKYIDRDAPKSGLASLMAMKGRYGDDNLVHMSDEEINALSTMGQLTINPDTGLPEAFGLRNILPIVANVGLGIATGGLSVPAQMAIMGGANFAMAKMAGADTSEALMQGVLAGGLAGASAAFSGAGDAAKGATGALPSGPQSAAAGGFGSQATGEFGKSAAAMSGGAKSAASSGFGAGPLGEFAGMPVAGTRFGTQAAGEFGGAAGRQSVNQAAKQAVQQSGNALTSPIKTIDPKGITGGIVDTLAGDGTAAKMAGKEMMIGDWGTGQSQLAALQKGATTAGLGLASAALTAQPEAPEPLQAAQRAGQSSYGTRAAEEIKQNYQPDGLSAEEVQASLEGSAEPLKFFTQQTASAPANFGSPAQGKIGEPVNMGGNRLMGTQYAAEGGSVGPNRDALLNIYLARGGDVGMFSGLVKDDGTGDGMSDNVEFDVVGDPEINKAMLSPDEYVIDAHTVAALGNGSTNKGAEVLDGFMQNVRSKAYNKGEQPKENAGLKELMKLQSQYG